MTFAKSLVSVQVALSLLLLVGAGLFLRTLWNLQSVDLGYPKERLLQLRIDAGAGGYEEARLAPLFRELSRRLVRLPGVRGVAYSENGLFSGNDSGDRVIVEGYTATGKDDQGAAFDIIGPGYFSTIGIPVMLGREFGAQDDGRAQMICIINDSFAKKFFAGRNPIGRHITQVFGDMKRTYEVAGVTANARDHSLRREVRPRMYLQLDAAGYIPDSLNFILRTTGEAESVLGVARKSVQGLDENLPIRSARSVVELVENRVVVERLIAELSAVFGIVALLLASIGLYGVLSYGVARRRSEIGIRMALGAARSTILGMILRETGLMVLVGIGVGLLAAAAATQLLTKLLYGVHPLDPLSIALSIAILAVVALLAGLLPARRAAGVSPVTALRHAVALSAGRPVPRRA